MIEYVDYFFGGHVEMTDMGFSGKRVDDRIESDEYLATVFDEAQSLARLMEPLNYDMLWLTVPAWHPYRLHDETRHQGRRPRQPATSTWATRPAGATGVRHLSTGGL